MELELGTTIADPPSRAGTWGLTPAISTTAMESQVEGTDPPAASDTRRSKLISATDGRRPPAARPFSVRSSSAGMK